METTGPDGKPAADLTPEQVKMANDRLEEAQIDKEIDKVVSGIGPAKPEDFKADNLRIITNINDALKLCLAELEKAGGDQAKRQEVKDKYAAQINSEIAGVKGDNNYKEALENAAMVLSDLDRA